MIDIIKKKRMFEICSRTQLPYPKTTYAILEHYPETHTKMKILVIFNEIFIKIVHSRLFRKVPIILVHMKSF